MTPPLLFEFQPDAAETIRASRLIQRRGRLGRIQWVVWPLLVGLVIMYRLGGVDWSQMGFLYSAAALLAALTIGAPWFQRRQLARAYAESPILRESQRYEFSSDGLTIRGGPSATTLGWEAIREASENEEFFLLFFAPCSAYYLPKHAVADPRKANALRVLLHAALGPRARDVRATTDVPPI